MKRIAWLLGILLCWAGCALAEEVVYTPDFEMRAWDAVSLPEGGFLFVGSLTGQDVRDANATAVWTDAQGKTLSSLPLHREADPAVLLSLVSIGEGRYAVLLEGSGEEGDYLACQLVVFEEGRILSEQQVLSVNYSIVPSLLPANGGFYTFTGDRVDKDKRNANFHVPALTLFDAEGVEQWRHVFDTYEWYADGALPVADGTLLLGSMEEQQTGKRNSHAVAVKMSDAGEMVWMVESPGRRWKSYRAAVQMPDGDFFVVGEHSDDPGSGIGGLSDQPVVARLSPQGETRWEKEVALDLEVVQFTGVIAVDGGYLVNVREVEYMPPVRLYLLDVEGEILQEFAYPQDEGFNLSKQTLLETPQGPCLLWTGMYEDTLERRTYFLYPSW